nr:hypothetical protein C4D60_Mb01t12470 [Ipomoea batatas]
MPVAECKPSSPEFGVSIRAGRSWPDRPALTGTMFISGGIGLNGPEALLPPTPAVLQLKLPLAFLSGPSKDPRTNNGDMEVSNNSSSIISRALDAILSPLTHRKSFKHLEGIITNLSGRIHHLVEYQA